jgi:ATP-binding cassette, subfamily F, member 3
MTLITGHALGVWYGAERIFQDISCIINRGDKIALVGPNGAGKSTLIRLLAGVQHPTRGATARARGTRIAYLAQEATFDTGGTLIEAARAAFSHIHAMEDELHALEQQLADVEHPEWEARMERYGDLHARFEHAGGFEIEHVIERTLDGLGFGPALFDHPLVTFSGGQKTRAALALTLLQDPDVLLLDEPTNHLDIASREALEQVLQEFPGSILFVSHNRYFVDALAERLWIVEHGGVTDFEGNYSEYIGKAVAA